MGPPHGRSLPTGASLHLRAPAEISEPWRLFAVALAQGHVPDVRGVPLLLFPYVPLPHAL
jgi:hypothetical protein